MANKRTILITGATSGLGLETARVLAEQGHTVIVASRGKEKVEATCVSLRESTNNRNIHPLTLDLGSLAAVKTSAEELLNQHADWAFDTLILNAGIQPPRSGLETSPEGFEIAFATNHLGHYYLTKLVTPRLLQNAKKHSSRARVVVVSSGTHDPANHSPLPSPVFDLEQWKLPSHSYVPVRCYIHSKLANALFGNDLASQYDPKELSVATFDPGFLETTNLGRGATIPFRSVLLGTLKLYMRAVSLIYGSTYQIGAMERSAPFLARLAVDSTLLSDTGRYYCIDAPDKCSKVASDLQCQIQLREFSDELLTAKGFVVE